MTAKDINKVTLENIIEGLKLLRKSHQRRITIETDPDVAAIYHKKVAQLDSDLVLATNKELF